MKIKKEQVLNIFFVLALFSFFCFRPAYQGGDKKGPGKKGSEDSLIGTHRYYLEMHGMITKTSLDPKIKGNPIDSVHVRILTDSFRLVAEYYSMRRGDCRFRLPLNRKLLMEIGKKGYVTKIVELNTKVPPEKKMVYVFPFDMDLFEVVPGLDMSVLKKPIAKVMYDASKENFEYDTEFTNNLNQSLKALYKSYREKISPPSATPTK